MDRVHLEVLLVVHADRKSGNLIKVSFSGVSSNYSYATGSTKFYFWCFTNNKNQFRREKLMMDFKVLVFTKSVQVSTSAIPLRYHTNWLI